MLWGIVPLLGFGPAGILQLYTGSFTPRDSVIPIGESVVRANCMIQIVSDGTLKKTRRRLRMGYGATLRDKCQ
jgi:hypothetical protein